MVFCLFFINNPWSLDVDDVDSTTSVYHGAMVLVCAQGRISTCCVDLECSSSSHILLGKTSHYLSEASQPPMGTMRSKLVFSHWDVLDLHTK